MICVILLIHIKQNLVLTNKCAFSLNCELMRACERGFLSLNRVILKATFHTK